MTRPLSGRSQILAVYRPSVASRVVWLAVGGAWAAILVMLAFAYFRDEIGLVEAIGGTFIGGVMVVYGVRDLFVKVEATPEGLEVSNYLSRKSFAWREISRFEGPGRLRRWTASAVLNSGKRIRLDGIPATALPFHGWRRGADVAVAQLSAILEQAEASKSR